MPFRSCVRFGSTTESIARVQINSVQGVKNSANKLLMKQCFIRAGVKTALWFKNYSSTEFLRGDNNARVNISQLPYPIVAKGLYGSRGVANYKLDNQQALETWMRNKDLSGYIWEAFSIFSKEYRIHVTSEGCFYSCRKLLKSTAPVGTWQRHDDGNVAWILETSPEFKRPQTWDLIIADCVRAQAALGLDISSFDVMCQGSNHERPDWIIIESQSAPSLATVGIEKYKIELPRVLRRKFNSL